ncbi:hypothetical protein Syun_014119 [Stephania yunnanensis]|uniref:Uncharacterized protein n=1 Tax=Stephania yunnanensis TaxID=152371 RepID=A0AAP0JIY4_9MAGN
MVENAINNLKSCTVQSKILHRAIQNLASWELFPLHYFISNASSYSQTLRASQEALLSKGADLSGFGSLRV